MGLFSRSDGSTGTDDGMPKVNGNAEDDEPETKTVTRTETREKQYTEHTATVSFIDGTKREFAFDSMSKGDNGYTFKNYISVKKKDYPLLGPHPKFVSEAFMSIPYNNVKTLETIERDKTSMEYEWEYEEEVPVDEVDD